MLDIACTQEKIISSAYRDVMKNTTPQYPNNSLYMNAYNYYQISLGNPTSTLDRLNEFTVGVIADLYT